MQLFSEQQQMFNFLRNDLHKYQEVYKKAMEFETMYSPLTPTHKYDKDKLKSLPTNDDGIVDLKSVMAEYDTPLIN